MKASGRHEHERQARSRRRIAHECQPALDGTRRCVARLVGRPLPGAEVGLRRGGLRAAGAAAAVPAAVPRHPEHQFRRHDGAVRDGRDHRDRPKRRGRPDRSARPRLRRLLRGRRLHRRFAHQSEQSVEQDGCHGMVQRRLGVAVMCAAGDGHHRAHRPDPRHADAAAARRLPGHRHARVRRDHPAVGRQPLRRHQRSPRSQRGRLSAGGGERTPARRRVLQRKLQWATPTTAPGGSGWAWS